MVRVGAQAQTIRDPGPTSNGSTAVCAPADPAPAFPHATKSADRPTIPAVLTGCLRAWLGDLTTLGREANATFTADPLGRFGLG